MQPNSAIFLRILFNRFHGGLPKNKLVSFSPETVNALLQYDTSSNDTSLVFKKDDHLHYSWLAPEIKKMPHSIQILILRSLPIPTSLKLGRLLGIKSPEQEKLLPEVFKKHLLKKIYTLVKKEHLIPVSFLPPSPLNFIATMTKAELIELIDFLGLFDLAEEMKKIIDQQRVKQFFACLTPKKTAFLRHCLHQKGKIVSTRLGLIKWDGKCDHLIELLHHRGIVRLGKALSGQNEDLIWHIEHILDVGRGTLLTKYYNQSPIAGITAALIQQIQSVLQFLKSKKGVV